LKLQGKYSVQADHIAFALTYGRSEEAWKLFGISLTYLTPPKQEAESQEPETSSETVSDTAEETEAQRRRALVPFW
jgi:hypothetical protein